MPIRTEGFGSDAEIVRGPGEFANPAFINLGLGQTLPAAFRLAQPYNPTEQLTDRYALETSAEGRDESTTISVEEANQQLTQKLQLGTDRISKYRFQELLRKQREREVDQQILFYGEAGLGTQLLGGFGASMTDPINLLFGFNPLSRFVQATRFAETLAATRSVASATQAARATQLGTGLLSVAVEGAAENALLSATVTYPQAQALGQQYELADALIDVGAGAAIPITMHGVGRVLERVLGTGVPQLRAEQEFMRSGRAPDFSEDLKIHIDRIDREVDEAVAEIQQKRMEMDFDEVSTPAPEAGIELKRPRAEDPIELEGTPLADRATDAEKAILRATPEEPVVRQVGPIVNTVTDNFAKLLDLTQQLGRRALERGHPEYLAIQRAIVDDLKQLNELIPGAHLDIDELKSTTGDRINIKSLKAMMKKVAEAKKQVDAGELGTLRQVRDAADVAAKKSYSKLVELQNKPGTKTATLEKWQAQHDADMEKLLNAQKALMEHGQPSVAQMIPLNDQLDLLAPGLRQLLDAEPEIGQSPLYRAKRQVFDNIKNRLKEESIALHHAAESGGPREHPKDIEFSQAVSRYLEGSEQNPNDMLQVLNTSVDQHVQAYEAAGLLTPEDSTVLKAIAKKYKNNQEQTKAIKKGAQQAIICAETLPLED